MRPEFEYLFSPEKVLNPSAVETGMFAVDSPLVSELADIFHTPGNNVCVWMCAPFYRDAICFFAADGRKVSRLDICLQCSSLVEDGQTEFRADEAFFEKLREFFRRLGHDVDQTWERVQRAAKRSPFNLKVMDITAQQTTTPTNRDLAFRIREEVFVHEQHVPRDEEYDEYDATAHHYLALADEQPVGAARWRPTANGVKLERFAVLAPYRSKGVGAVLLKQVIADARAAHPEALLYLHAQVPALEFYKRHGFEPEGELFYECEIAHFKMKLT